MLKKTAGFVVAALLILGSCNEAQQPAPHPAGATPYTDAEKAETASKLRATTDAQTELRADAAVACGLALLEAERRGLVTSDSAVPQPWQIRSAPIEGGDRVSCDAKDSRGGLVVVVDLLCTDVNADRCHPLVRIER